MCFGLCAQSACRCVNGGWLRQFVHYSRQWGHSNGGLQKQWSNSNLFRNTWTLRFLKPKFGFLELKRTKHYSCPLPFNALVSLLGVPWDWSGWPKSLIITGSRHYITTPIFAGCLSNPANQKLVNPGNWDYLMELAVRQIPFVSSHFYRRSYSPPINWSVRSCFSLALEAAWSTGQEAEWSRCSTQTGDTEDPPCYDKLEKHGRMSRWTELVCLPVSSSHDAVIDH